MAVSVVCRMFVRVHGFHRFRFVAGIPSTEHVMESVTAGDAQASLLLVLAAIFYSLHVVRLGKIRREGLSSFRTNRLFIESFLV